MSVELTDLQQKVIEQLGYEELDEDVAGILENVLNHGAEGGFVGFTYYADTLEFFNNNKDLILELAEEMADDLGEDMLSMVANFNCLSAFELTPTEVAKAIYETNAEWETNVKNVLSWFALEEVARQLEEEVAEITSRVAEEIVDSL